MDLSLVPILNNYRFLVIVLQFELFFVSANSETKSLLTFLKILAVFINCTKDNIFKKILMPLAKPGERLQNLPDLFVVAIRFNKIVKNVKLNIFG